MSHAWWRETVVYQIYPRSFFDTNGDGIGDLRGIIEKLDYLQDLGVETLWISPFFASPQRDFGYDVSDYRAIAPEYGSMDDCAALIEAVHARDMKIVLDLVLNHTSDQHPWFLASRSSRENEKRDWYVWADGRRPNGQAPPNNWYNMIGSRGWHWDAATGQWYWSQFLPFQPDLNYRNPEVRRRMLDVLRFWMAKGADGFRLDIVNAIFEDPELRDNPFTWKLLPSPEDPSILFRSTRHTLNHPDTLDLTRELRRVVDSFDDRERFLVGEVIAPLETTRRFLGENADGLHLTFAFESLTAPFTARAFGRMLERYERTFPDPYLPTWVFSNHDRMRYISRLGGDLERAKLHAAFQLTARGVPFIYQGEEIGMEQHRLPVRRSHDPVATRFLPLPQLAFDLFRWLTGESLNRDECRTPMQWSRDPHAGFCPPSARPWIPAGPTIAGRNVAEQRPDSDSLLACYRRFLSVRRETTALRRGDLRLEDESARPSSVLGYRRRAESGDEVLVLLNFSPRPATAPLPASSRLLVSTRTQRAQPCGPAIDLAPWEGTVLTTT